MAIRLLDTVRAAVGIRQVSTRPGAKVRELPSTTTDPSEPTRIISIDANLNFGEVEVGDTAALPMIISNLGTETLTVSDITLPSGFSVDWDSGSIAPSATQEVEVTFTPILEQEYAGTLTVVSDKTSGANTEAIYGEGVSVETFYRISAEGDTRISAEGDIRIYA